MGQCCIKDRVTRYNINRIGRVSPYFRDDSLDFFFDIDDLLRSVTRVCHVRSDREIASFEKKQTFENNRIDLYKKVQNIIDFNERVRDFPLK